jgi:undecaprenyl-diphosphatase
MDTSFQALVMGLVQGLTEFIPVSSSGHLVLVPWFFGWKDPFIDSLAFSVVLHMGTLLALLLYFWRDWLRIVPAGLASIRDRSIGGDEDRRLAWLIALSTVPALMVGPLLSDQFESLVREAPRVALMLCVGAAILWLAERWGARDRDMSALSFPGALFIGAAQAVALVPGISRSGISISAAMFLGLRRESAARFSFLMATPAVGGAGLWEGRKLLTGESGVSPDASLIAIGFVSAFLAGLVAIRFMLEFLRRQPNTLFIVYRVLLAIAVFAVLLSPHGA